MRKSVAITQFFSSNLLKCHQDTRSPTALSPNKTEVYRFRMTVGGDRLDAYQDVQSSAVDILDAKIHINSTISDAHKGARYCTAANLPIHVHSLPVHSNRIDH